MLEAGCGPYIGLPANPNVEEFNSLVDRAERFQLDMNPITILTSLLREEQEVIYCGLLSGNLAVLILLIDIFHLIGKGFALSTQTKCIRTGPLSFPHQ